MAVSTIDPTVAGIMNTAAAQTTQRQSDHNNNFLQMLDRVFGKSYSEPDIMESAAARQLVWREAPMEPSPRNQ